MPDAPTDPLLGRLVAGKYRLECLLGQGGMGAVYQARQLALGKKIALKVMRAEHAADPMFAARFHREAQAASRLDHENSIRILDFGEEPDGLLYIAMELLDGRDLAAIVDEDFVLSPERIVDLLSQALSVLAAAHDMGIIHRDLKPENIMIVTRRGPDSTVHEHVKVCDFGIAKMNESGEVAGDSLPARAMKGKLTAAGVVLGTPEYMSPEQGRGEVLDARSDLYSMGIILYLLLAGRTPFDAPTPMGILIKHHGEEPAAPSSVRPDVDPRLEAVCLKAIRKRPDERYASALDMREALQSVLGSEAKAAAAATFSAPPSGRGDAPPKPARLSNPAAETLAAGVDIGSGASFSPAAAVPDLVLPPKDRVSPSSRPRTGSARPPSEQARRSVPVVAASPAPLAAFDDDPAPAARIELDTASLGAASLASRSMGARVPPRFSKEPAPLPRAKRRRRWLIFSVALAMLLGSGAGAVYAAPRYVAYRVGEAARRSGLEVTFDDVVFRPDSLTLLGTKVRVVELENVTVKVGEVVIALDRARPVDVLVHGFDVSVRGDLGEMGWTLEEWVGRRPSLPSLRGVSGHVAWAHPLGDGTELEAWDVSASGGAEHSVSSPSLVIRTSRATFGPWRVAFVRATAERKLEASLNPASAQPAFAWRRDGEGAGEATLEIPASPLSSLGIPTSALGLAGDPSLEAHARATWSATGKVEGNADLTFGGARATPANAPADLVIGGSLSADSWTPIMLSGGHAGAGKARGQVTGSIALAPGALRVELGMKWPAQPASTLPTSLVLDTRNLGKR